MCDLGIAAAHPANKPRKGSPAVTSKELQQWEFGIYYLNRFGLKEKLIYSYFLLYWMILYFYPSEKIGQWQLQACSHINYHHLE